MVVVQGETFGPVAPCTVVDSWEMALALAGSEPCGLAATVLTPDPAHVLAAVHRIDVGTVKVNAVFGGAPREAPSLAVPAARGAATALGCSRS